MTQTMKYLGITDEYNACTKCGKTNLKKTVVLEINESIEYWGTDCAAKVLYGKNTKANKDMVARRATAAQYARNCAINDRSLEYIRDGIWNRFGFSSVIKDGALYAQFESGQLTQVA